MTAIIPCEGRTITNVFGDESVHGRVTKLYADHLTKNFVGQPGWLIILRLALATEMQISNLHNIGLVSARRIRKRIALEFDVEPRREDETTMECFQRFFPGSVRPLMTARLLTEINLNDPTKRIDDYADANYVIIQAFDAINEGELDMREIAFRGPEKLTETIEQMFNRKIYEVTAYRVVRDNIPTVFTLLKMWGLEYLMPPQQLLGATA